MNDRIPKLVLGFVVACLILAVFGYSTPKVNYSSQQVFCLSAICLKGTGFDKQCLESQPKLAQMHIVDDGGSQRVVFEQTDKLCKENNNGIYRARKSNP